MHVKRCRSTALPFLSRGRTDLEELRRPIGDARAADAGSFVIIVLRRAAVYFSEIVPGTGGI
jgi:hypothetical protein